VTFVRDDSGDITAVDVEFLRRTVRAEKRRHPQYVGSQVCRECHAGGGPNNEYMRWISSRHAAAYWRLATDWAVLLASSRDAYQDITKPIEEGRCLFCHTTAAQDADALLATTYRIAEGVGCEACHGPGSLYLYQHAVGGREAFLDAGGVVPEPGDCRRCHRNAERFDFEKWWPKVDHGSGPDAGNTHRNGD